MKPRVLYKLRRKLKLVLSRFKQLRLFHQTVVIMSKLVWQNSKRHLSACKVLNRSKWYTLRDGIFGASLTNSIFHLVEIAIFLSSCLNLIKIHNKCQQLFLNFLNLKTPQSISNRFRSIDDGSRFSHFYEYALESF